MKITKNTAIIALVISSGALWAQSEPADAPVPPAPAADEASGKLPPDAKARILKEFDKDGDGFLNEEELAAAKKAMEERRERFKQMQKRLSEKIIAEYDTDKDGKLSAEELIPFLDKQHQMFSELRAQLPLEVRQKMRREAAMRRGEGMRGEGMRGGEGRPRQHLGNPEAPRGPRGGEEAPRPDRENATPPPADGNRPRREGPRGQGGTPPTATSGDMMHRYGMSVKQKLTPDDLDELAKPKSE